MPEGQFKETFEYDDRGREVLHVRFEGLQGSDRIHKRTVYDDSPVGGGRVLRVELFASAADFAAFKNGTAFNGNLPAGTKWERVVSKYDAFGRMIGTDHQYADAATAGQPMLISFTENAASVEDGHRIRRESDGSVDGLRTGRAA